MKGCNIIIRKIRDSQRRRRRSKDESFTVLNGAILLEKLLTHAGRSLHPVRIFTAKDINREVITGFQSSKIHLRQSNEVIDGIGRVLIREFSNHGICKSSLENSMAEIVILSNIRHKNIVRLVGCCLETPVPTVVYEDNLNGNLEDYIREQNNPRIPWSCCLRIAIGVADGLSYLHNHRLGMPIVHHNVNPGNIVLDDWYNPKLENFTLSVPIPKGKEIKPEEVTLGSIYMDPEYRDSGIYTTKSDVYSFGVVLFVLVTGKLPEKKEKESSSAGISDDVFFVSISKEMKLVLDDGNGTLTQIWSFGIRNDDVDRMLEEVGAEREKLCSFLDLAKRCVLEKGDERPTMKEVLMELRRIQGNFKTIPKKAIMCYENNHLHPLNCTIQNLIVRLDLLDMKSCERAANIALAVSTLAPLVVPVNSNLNVILTACLTVYVGCYRSVKPTPPTETISSEHAMRFPLIGSAMLLSLFLLFKFLSKDLVNAVLTCYFFVLGILALSATLLPAIKRFLPNNWNDNLITWRIPYFTSTSMEFTVSQVIAAIPGTFFCVWYAKQKHWLANNILGIAFCVQGMEMLSLGTFKTGAILLAGLFVYDIFWVFFTPVMVSVAKSFDAPIKLLFPTSDSARPFFMLGLGDIVIPGIFVALALRFDVSRGKDNRYFKSAFVGYTVGLVLTIVVMNWLQAAQPPLLYIVPGVIGFVGVHCFWNGEIKPLLEYDESKDKENDTIASSTSEDDDEGKDKKEE